VPKIGMSSSAMILAGWMDALKAAAENGFDAFEISCVFPSADPQEILPGSIAESREIIQNNNLEISVHAPFFEINIAAYCKSIRQESIRIIKTSIDLCHELGGNVLIAHNGNFTYNLTGATRNNHMAYEIQWKYNIEALKQINKYANTKGITVCLENIAINDSSIDRSFEDLLEIREAVGDSLQFTLDMGHARLSEGAAKGIQLLGDNIRHIHLSDNHGKIDDHLPLGNGNYDFTGFVEFLRDFKHIITLEVVDIGTNPNPVLRSREALCKLLAV